uniref:Uncharacterized protein n=1 Tax=Anguilla anguilla TaxID=7936 RepID=A0A0E9TRG9_ANGAN
MCMVKLMEFFNKNNKINKSNQYPRLFWILVFK